MQQLATLNELKAWVEDNDPVNSGDVDDVMLTSMLDQASQFILDYLQRPTLLKKAYTDVRNGYGQPSIVLRQWPVSSVQGVISGTATFSAAPVPPLTGSGFVFEPWDGYPPGRPALLSLQGGVFARGPGQCRISYIAGYWINAEPAIVPATPYAVTVAQPVGKWAQDEGVTLANGTILTKVASNPQALQYTAAEGGIYTFNAAQSGASILISYSYIPSIIRQACCEIAGERYRYKRRIGQQSNTTAGQITVTFSLKALQDYVREGLDRYRKVNIL